MAGKIVALILLLITMVFSFIQANGIAETPQQEKTKRLNIVINFLQIITILFIAFYSI